MLVDDPLIVFNMADAVWSAGTRTLVSGSPATPTTEAEEIAKAFWENATRTLAAPTPPTGYQYFRVVGYKNEFSLTDFPLLYSFTTDAVIGAHINSAGTYIRTTDIDGTSIPYGIITFSKSGSNATGNIRVKVSPDNSEPFGQFVVWFDDGTTPSNPASDGQNKSGVLDSNVVAYLPLEEDPTGTSPPIKDWSSNANHGTNTGSMASGTLVAGKVGNSLNFAGSDDRIDLLDNGNQFGSLTALTISCLAKLSNNFGDQTYLVTTKADDTLGPYVGQNGYAQFNSRIRTSSNVLDPTARSYGVWYHVAMTYDGTTQRLYVNGAEVGTAAATGSTTASNGVLYIGNRNGDDRAASAVIDEVVYSKTTRSANWISLDYNTQFNQSQYVAGGSSFTVPASGAITGTSTITLSTGTCSLTGSGSLTGSSSATFATGTCTLAGSGSLVGSSTITLATGTCTLLGAGALAGSSALTITGSATPFGSLSFIVGTAALTFSPGNATLLGSAPITGSGAIILSGSATLLGSGTLSGLAPLVLAGSGTILGDGTLTGTSSIVIGATATLSDLTAVPYRTRRMIIDVHTPVLEVDN